MNYVFDIDGTICNTENSDYENSKPITSRIDFVNSLYDDGHHIVFHTARGMGRSKNSFSYANTAFYELTRKQLLDWGVKFHELHLGKPAGDVYVDDKGKKDRDFFERPKPLKRDTNLKMNYVPKGWGWEKWVVNGPEYCGKLLFFNKGKKCSWHLHRLKDEVFYLKSGKLKVYYSDSDDLSKASVLILNPGENFHVYRGLRHQMLALEDSELFEFSTTHFDSDSYRIIKGD
mgnify:CR=1 FL=1|tara:strand:+ start:3471 stop:4163 length:693 start_codon:yes stop_codon:yes gene_type:complete